MKKVQPFDRVKIIQDSTGHNVPLGSTAVVSAIDDNNGINIKGYSSATKVPRIDYILTGVSQFSIERGNITLTDLEDVIDQIMELEEDLEKPDALASMAVARLEFIRRALSHIQSSQKTKLSIIEDFCRDIHQSIG